MNFIAILVPAILVAVGILVCGLAVGSEEKGTLRFRVMLSVGAVLCIAGCYFEFFASLASATEIFLRAIVVLNAVAVVIATAVSKRIDTDSRSFTGAESVCSAVFNARATRNVCSVMTVVLASIVTTI